MEELIKQEWFWITAILGLVTIIAVLRYGDKIKLLFKTKGAEMTIEGANATPQAPPSSTVKNIKSQRGGVRYQDNTGQTLTMDGVDAQKDIDITRSQGGDPLSKK